MHKVTVVNSTQLLRVCVLGKEIQHLVKVNNLLFALLIRVSWRTLAWIIICLSRIVAAANTYFILLLPVFWWLINEVFRQVAFDEKSLIPANKEEVSIQIWSTDLGSNWRLSNRGENNTISKTFEIIFFNVYIFESFSESFPNQLVRNPL